MNIPCPRFCSVFSVVAHVTRKRLVSPVLRFAVNVAKTAFVLNGKRVSVEAHPMKRLLDVLREDCGLTGTKEGCGEGECGACTVLIDGRAINCCLVPLAQAAGTRITTIEGLGTRHPLQRAFVAHGGAQCGIC